jgi:Spy/CpxP family protein refolding chaperone
MALVSRRSLMLVATMLATWLAVVSNLSAQQGRTGGRGGFGFGGFGGRGGEVSGSDWLGLLQNEKVQKEIDLLDDQKAEVRKVADESREKMRSVFQGFGNFREASEQEREKMQKEMGEKMQANTKETVKRLEGVLLPPQVARLKEISLQVRGTSALNDPEVEKQLGISEQQQAQLEKIREEQGEKMRGLFSGNNNDRDQAREKMAELRKESSDRALAALSAEQRDKFEKLKGKPVTADLDELRRGGFTGGRGGPGGQGGTGGQQRRRPGGNNN